MQNDLLLILSSLIIGFTVLYFLLSKKQSSQELDKTLIEWLKTMQKGMTETNSSVIKTLQENSRQLNDRLDRAAIAIRDVNKGIGEMSEIGRNMRELQEFLKSPKLRGNIGEEVLKDLISQMFQKNIFFLRKVLWISVLCISQANRCITN